MCGRARCTLARGQVTEAAGTSRWIDQDRYRPSHNLSPGSWTPVVRRDADGTLEVHTMRWGLVPSFTKKDGTKAGDPWRMFNARSETVGEKPAFRRLVPTRRCLVLMDGFYEWKKEAHTVGGGSGKQPYFVHLAGGEVMVMAGLWDVWDGPEEGPLHSYTILTTDASPRLDWLHDRMPLLLRDKAAQQLWLDTSDPSAARTLNSVMVPYNGEDLRWYQVTKAMSSPSYQEADASAPMAKPPARAFFQPRTGVPRRSAAAKGAGAESTALPDASRAEVATPPPAASKAEEAGGRDAAVGEAMPSGSAAQRHDTPRKGAAVASAPAEEAPEPIAGLHGKRKADGGPSPGPGSAKKKPRPAGQLDITKFLAQTPP